MDEAAVPLTAVKAIGLTGQMHGLVLLDASGQALRPAILWNDQRTGAQCEEIERRVGREKLIELAGKPALTGFTAPKVLWVQEHEPRVFAAAAHLLLPKDYVRFRMTRCLAMDVADASGTLLLDVGRRAWSEEIIDALDVPRRWLPQLMESPQVCASVDAEGAAATGLREGTPVVAGAGDQAAEAVGCGIVEEGNVSVTIGTSGVVFASLDRFDAARIGKLHAYCHAIPDRWHVMGVMLSAGGSLRWYRELFGERPAGGASSDELYAALLEEAAEVPPGAEGLLFLPYLAGERTPHADPLARGALVGLTLRHGRGHLTRAVLEGITFGLMDSLRLLREIGVHIGSVRVSGGGARSHVWRQMMADVFRCDIATVNVSQGAAYGAALLAGVGVGVFQDVDEAVRQTVKETGRTSPGPASAQYETCYDRFRALYPTLAPTFRQLSDANQ
jgi:xylulokinase